MGKVMLTNTSERVFDTKQGKFHPGTSKEYDEVEAAKLLQYSDEIKKTENVVGTSLKAIVEKKDAEIKKLKTEIKKLEMTNEDLEEKLKSSAKRR